MFLLVINDAEETTCKAETFMIMSQTDQEVVLESFNLKLYYNEIF